MKTESNPPPVPDPDQDPAVQPLDAPDRRPTRRRRLWVGIAAVISVAVPVVGIAVPNYLSSQLNANESAAIATLKNISSAQSQVQALGCIDCNRNGQGEYGYFAELAGAVPLRTAADVGDPARSLDPPVLSERFAHVRHGRVQSGGYVFQLFLRGVDGVWLPESTVGGAVAGVDAHGAELGWLCYAWPVEHGKSGRRAFLASQSGCVLATNMAVQVYSGDRAPPAGVAGHYLKDGKWQPAANTNDVFGERWVIT